MNSSQLEKQSWLSRFIQAMNFFVMRTLYRISCAGADKLPAPGQGALLVCNHAAYLDACLVLAALRRPVTFLIDRTIYQHPLVKPFVKASGVIPIEAGKNRREIELALEEAAQRIAAGELVCIFAEGGITRLGILLPFRKGIERIMRDRSEPIIPMFLDGTWASVFGFKGGKFFLKRLSGWRIPVRLFVGEAIPSKANAWQVRKHVQELAIGAAASDADCRRKLGDAFLKVAKKNRYQTAIVTSDGWALSYAMLLNEVLSLAKEIKGSTSSGSRIGIVSDGTVLTVISHLAIAAAGKVAVVLDSSDLAQGDKLERLGIVAVVSPEDINDELVVIKQAQLQHGSMFNSLAAVLKSYFRVNLRAGSAAVDEQTLIVDGVGLSHHNILRCVKDISELCRFATDSQFAVSGDFSNVIGIIANIWAPLLSGGTVSSIGALDTAVPIADKVFHISTMGGLSHSTLALFETLTVVGGTCRVGQDDEEPRRVSFYGVGDIAPVVLVRLPNFYSKEVKQIGNKPEANGHPLLSVELKVVDSQSHVLLEPGNYGVLLLRGPVIAASVTKGKDALLVPVQAAEDNDGFISIKH